MDKWDNVRCVLKNYAILLHRPQNNAILLWIDFLRIMRLYSSITQGISFVSVFTGFKVSINVLSQLGFFQCKGAVSQWRLVSISIKNMDLWYVDRVEPRHRQSDDGCTFATNRDQSSGLLQPCEVQSQCSLSNRISISFCQWSPWSTSIHDVVCRSEVSEFGGVAVHNVVILHQLSNLQLGVEGWFSSLKVNPQCHKKCFFFLQTWTWIDSNYPLTSCQFFVFYQNCSGLCLWLAASGSWYMADFLFSACHFCPTALAYNNGASFWVYSQCSYWH